VSAVKGNFTGVGSNEITIWELDTPQKRRRHPGNTCLRPNSRAVQYLQLPAKGNLLSSLGVGQVKKKMRIVYRVQA
jgi:hypothetical protein